jgi:hypothetical protein
MYKIALSMALMAGTAVVALPAKASTITWTLSGVTFYDGSTATGWFKIDSVSGNLSAWDITTTFGGSGFFGAVYDSTLPGTPVFGLAGDTTIEVINASGNVLSLFFSKSFSLGGFDPISGLGFECLEDPCFDHRYVMGGQAQATPLPPALPLFASGLGVMGWLGWRRKRKGIAVSAA